MFVGVVFCWLFCWLFCVFLRSVRATAFDQIYCMQLAQNAVHGAMAGYTAFSAAVVNNRTVRPSRLQLRLLMRKIVCFPPRQLTRNRLPIIVYIVLPWKRGGTRTGFEGERGGGEIRDVMTKESARCAVRPAAFCQPLLWRFCRSPHN